MEKFILEMEENRVFTIRGNPMKDATQSNILNSNYYCWYIPST